MSKALELRNNFIAQLRSENMQARIEESLPPDVDKEFFTAVIIRAVQEDPALLGVDNKMSLFLACQRAAQDGLLPDGREGALVIYNRKQQGVWQSGVQWQPMIGGLRKRLASFGFDLRAHVVCEFDDFDYELGDRERVLHKPAPLGEDRGEIIGAYAIASQGDQRWREVMDRLQLDAIKAISKSGSKGPWGSFFSEMARKTVAKRLIKSLPLHDNMIHDIIARDNEQYVLDALDMEDRPPRKSQQIQEEARKKAVKKKAPARKKAARRKEPPPEPEPKVIEGSAEELPPQDDSEIPLPDDSEVPPDAAAGVDDDDEGFKGVDPGF